MNILETSKSKENSNSNTTKSVVSPRPPPPRPTSRKGRPVSAKLRPRPASLGSIEGSLHINQGDVPQGSLTNVRLDTSRSLSRTTVSGLSCFRPVSQVSSNQTMRPKSQEVCEEKVPVPPPLKSRGSFSKFTPLPSIGVGPDNIASEATMAVKPVLAGSDECDLTKDTESTVCEQQQISYVIPVEPSEAYPDRIRLAIKLLDGQRHERWFRTCDTLGSVLEFARSLSDRTLLPCQFCTNEVPRRVFNDFSKTLAQTGLKSYTMLYLDHSMD